MLTCHLDPGERPKSRNLSTVRLSPPHLTELFVFLLLVSVSILSPSFTSRSPPRLFPLHLEKKKKKTNEYVRGLSACVFSASLLFALMPEQQRSPYTGVTHYADAFSSLPSFFPPTLFSLPSGSPWLFLMSSHDVFDVISSFQNKGMQRWKRD